MYKSTTIQEQVNDSHKGKLDTKLEEVGDLG